MKKASHGMAATDRAAERFTFCQRYSAVQPSVPALLSNVCSARYHQQPQRNSEQSQFRAQYMADNRNNAKNEEGRKE